MVVRLGMLSLGDGSVLHLDNGSQALNMHNSMQHTGSAHTRAHGALGSCIAGQCKIVSVCFVRSGEVILLYHSGKVMAINRTTPLCA